MSEPAPERTPPDDTTEQAAGSGRARATTRCPLRLRAVVVTAGMPVAPPRPTYEPGVCGAPSVTPGVRCLKPAHPYPAGWFCDPHKPGATRTETSDA
jgi:hypothetical protein